METPMISATLVLPRAHSNSTNKTEEAEAFLNNLFFAESKSVRTSTIILASFNILVSFATIIWIVYDCYWASRRYNTKFKASSRYYIPWIHPAETFPLVLSTGIMIQGLVFAGSQGMGLKSLNEPGCAVISQLMWPALFIVPYIQLVFGLECTIRSLRRLPFPPRGKYDVVICLGLVCLMLLGTWIPSHINPEHDVCFASLLWFISRYGVEGVILLSICAALILVSAGTIFLRLSRAKSVELDQRTAASRMVYYLVLGFVSLAFVIPFFASLAGRKGDIKASMIATVVINLSGLMSGVLHLFLRSHTTTTSFGPKTERSRWDQKKRQFSMWGADEFSFKKAVFGHGSFHHMETRTESRAGLVVREKEQQVAMESLQFKTGPLNSSKPMPPQTTIDTRNIPAAPVPAADPASVSPQRPHSRKQSYSLFPTAAVKVQPPPKVTEDTDPSSDDVLEPPPRIFAGNEGGLRVPNHRRDSSIESSATVQIGLRLSHARTPSQAELMSQSLSASTSKPPPLQMGALRPSPLTTTGIAYRPSPLRNNPPTPQDLSIGVNKTLPPTPRDVAEPPAIQLNPTVYKPPSSQKSSPLRQNTLAGPSTNAKEMSMDNELGENKADWI